MPPARAWPTAHGDLSQLGDAELAALQWARIDTGSPSSWHSSHAAADDCTRCCSYAQADADFEAAWYRAKLVAQESARAAARLRCGCTDCQTRQGSPARQRELAPAS